MSAFVGAGLEAGHAGIVIATRPHREGLERRLSARQALAGAALCDSRYLALDAAATLAELMVDGRPDEGRFAAVMGDLIQQAAEDGSRPVLVFGEMVSLLWAEGRHEAAIRLEELWSDLASTHSFSLLCAYPMDGFRHEEHGSFFLHICEAHSQVRHAESFTEPADPDELRRQVALLQQKAVALEAEVEKRKQAEQVLRRLESELERQLEQLAEIDHRKNEFLAMLGHELRNPLAAIVTSAEVMRKGGPAHLDRAREIVARQAALMARLVDDLLDVSRITRGTIVLKAAEEVLLDAIVERAVEGVRPLIDERRHRLAVDLPAEPVLLSGDAVRLVQVVANLLSNAAKYTDPGGTIELRAHRDGTDLLLRVRDDGIGMTPELCERVFEPFVQAPGSQDRARGGLGIGLTLVRRLVELHGGRIEARSDGPGRGSELVVSLPVPRRPSP